MAALGLGKFPHLVQISIDAGAHAAGYRNGHHVGIHPEELEMLPRQRLAYRPLDVALWRDYGVLLELPARLAAVRSPAPEDAEPTAPDAAAEVREAAFGCFAGNKPKAAA